MLEITKSGALKAPLVMWQWTGPTTCVLFQKEEEDRFDAASSQTSPHETYGEENSPIEQVALTVSVADDQTLPVVTFRMWTLGTLACVLLSFLNQFFWYRKEPLSITSISAQIAVVPLGHLMASTITNRVFFKGRKFEFTLNPGPFNVKEHVLITIFANSGAGNVFAVYMVSAVKVFYRKNLTFLVSLFVVITTQVLGFGWAGMFRRYLVEPAGMWWPANLVQVSLFRGVVAPISWPGILHLAFMISKFNCASETRSKPTQCASFATCSGPECLPMVF
ncbi:hypothetical protein TEA_018395 [Camellia sinensis var. sinensis]|uniref:Uncharacterized protein n=1 Tax=Camellia sinensis var. sinensis TaxID=542762 RepID=A0A4S4CW39_CAMSN|nr:hypothetical protein TEA_018395 [Camellia sinensis var. sinensis]